MYTLLNGDVVSDLEWPNFMFYVFLYIIWFDNTLPQMHKCHFYGKTDAGEF